MSARGQSVRAADGAVTASVLCDAVQSLAETLHPHLKGRISVDLDTTFDRDLGLDSLTRIELLTRLEREFGVTLSEHDMTAAETPRDLLRALESSAPGARTGEDAAADSRMTRDDSAPASAPAETSTLVDALLWHAEAHPDRTHVHLLDEASGARKLGYGELLDQSLSVAAGLRARGFEPGQAAAIMLPTGVAYFFSFFGILLAGGVPVPIYPPARISQIEDHFRRHARILGNAGARFLITFEQAKQVTRLLASQVDTLDHVVTVEDLQGDQKPDVIPNVDGKSIAFLQYTSGSTGSPKGVVLTHANILASLDSMRQALAAEPSDVFVSWLPLYHDMGLIGAWMGSLVVGFPLVLMSPLSFLRRPESWLHAIETYQGTLSGGPNFAFELCTRRIREEDIDGLDLGSWRLAFNGAEPVSPATLRSFTDRFSRYGFRESAMTPVYGLAEATLGVAFTPINRGPRIDRINRRTFSLDGRATPVADEETDAVEFVSCGVPISGFEVRIVDDTGFEAGEREEGAVEFRGPSTTSGYYRNPKATRTLFHDEWLVSGDRGYIADGEVFITGRSKDVVIRAGRNIYPYELEQAVADVERVRRGCVAVFGASASGTERLVVVAETRETGEARRGEIRAQIERLTQDLLGMPADDVVLVPPHTVLKTSSGKIRRAAIRDLYERGALAPSVRAVWLQLLRLGLAGIAPSIKRLSKTAGAWAWAAYAAVVFAGLVLLAWPAVVLSKTPDTAFRRASRSARAAFALARIPIDISGLEHLPKATPFVLAANHSSYLDGLALAAVLPRRISFVAKRELSQTAFSGLFLRALGVQFVERFDHRRGAEDAQTIASTLSAGTPLCFFPEGTLHRMPGLLAFQLGAFSAAVEAGTCVIPVVIRGTRSILRGDSWFARKGRIRIEVLAPIYPQARNDSSAWQRAVSLRDQTRNVMLQRCGEPDLADRRALQDLKDHLKDES
jgi:acyl carrier protein